MSYTHRRSCISGLFLLLLALSCEANSGFIGVKDSHFELNGSPFLFNGFNSYWLMHVAADPAERYKVTEVLKDASTAGLSVCRTWAFSDGGDRALQISPGVYDERVFQGLDFVIAEAKKYGVRLILSFVNQWNDFGGKAEYVWWARNAGVQISNDDEFYTHPILKKYLKNHIEVVTRLNSITKVAYKDDATIMAWELMNEPRDQADYSGKTVNVGWVQEMASFVKSLDNKHLLEVGMEGFYGDSIPERKLVNPGYQVGTDFISNHLINEIDFATIHAYTDQWLSGQSDEAQLAWMEKWIRSHWEDARNILKKPLVLAEFGKSSRSGEGSRDIFMSSVYRNVYNLAKEGGTMGGSLVWQLMAHGMENYDDGYSIVLGLNPSTTQIISNQAHIMTALAHSLNHE
uniref:Mannan endo-1,4-beta-mannosidase 3 n=1 Tax=Solanum lycopersicum TaxID=4081 RepID=MAN3_SOLLC|nr:RecName: Full=Mannan endo-1,4-beta-mannosidase 3; AltName: Full=Beta-mannanase 3; AltName: Full=Endo-beta-1,4-mannanase 3; AltName: Full=LeMAN3; Flags: Precursor [Solanum lycopersicum]AAG14352.1 endo-beta-mannanase [Solanum lycopersicum]